jgi:hypothetical protein
VRHLAKTRVNELRDTLDKVVNQRDALKERVGELEELLTKFKADYNPNFNDEGVKAAIRSFEDYSARQAERKDEVVNDEDILSVLKEDGENGGVNWSEFEEDEGTDTDIRKSTVPEDDTLLTRQSTTLRHTSLLPSALSSTTLSTTSVSGLSPMESSPTTQPPAKNPLSSAQPAKLSTQPNATSPTKNPPSTSNKPISTSTTVQTISSVP